MRRSALLIVFLLFLSACSGFGSGPQSGGPGVQTVVLNGAELNDVYLPYAGGPPLVTDPNALAYRGGGWEPLFIINSLVQNRGYSNSVAAMYITGFDPNLFQVKALGPYIRNDEFKFCYKDIAAAPNHQFSLYIFCELAENVLVGGGIQTGETNSGNFAIERGLLSFFNLDATSIADRVERAIFGEQSSFFEDTGLLSNIDISCDWRRDGNSQGSNAGIDGVGVNFGEGLHCTANWGYPGFLFGEASYGNLLLGQYADTMRNCGNGCTLIPPAALPNRYIAGSTPDFPGGESLYVDHLVLLDTNRWPDSLQDHEQMFQISTCYLYTTYLTPTVCIDPTPATTDGEACRTGVIPVTDPQAAPIVITEIEQRSMGPRSAFTIHLENVGPGSAFDPGAIDYCSPASPSTYSRQHVNVLRVIDARVLGAADSLDCKSDRIYMRNGAGQITCLYDVDPRLYQTGAYQTTLLLEIGYLYRDIHTIRANIHRI